MTQTAEKYAVEKVARMARCPVSLEEFLQARPEVQLTLNGLRRRCRARNGFPGAIRLPGSRGWSIDLVTYDRVVSSMLLKNESEMMHSIEAFRQELPADLRDLGDNESVMRLVEKKLADMQVH